MKGKKVLTVLMIIVLILGLLLTGGFAYLYFHGLSGMVCTTQAQPGQIKIACVGDSITYGHGISGWPGNTYPAALQALAGDGYHVNNYGVSGYALQDTADRPYMTLEHYQQSLAYDADYVVFMMGSNDSKPENWIDAQHFRAELETILDSYGDTRIILCTPPAAFFQDDQTTGVTSHDIQPLVVAQIAEVVRQVAADRGYPLADIHALTAENPQWFSKDGVHPDQDGAAAIAQQIYQVLSEIA